ncbi:hypothetical protein SprV_0100102900 [Sparganum proliferum]
MKTDFLASYDDTASLEPGVNSCTGEAHYYESDSFESDDETYKAEMFEGLQKNELSADHVPTEDDEDVEQEENDAVVSGVSGKSKKGNVYKKQVNYSRAGPKGSTYTSILSRKLSKSARKPSCPSLKSEAAVSRSSSSTPRSHEISERDLGLKVSASCDGSSSQSFLRKLEEQDVKITGIEPRAHLQKSDQDAAIGGASLMQNPPAEKPIPTRFPGSSAADDFIHSRPSVRNSKSSISQFTSDPQARIADLEKETHLQNELIKGFQRENEKLMTENKKLKEKAASSALPEAQINSAERLFRENAVLHIELDQVKEELAGIKALRNAEGLPEARKKYECEIANLKTQKAELEQECQKHRQRCTDTLQELNSARVELSDLLKRCASLSQMADSATANAEARCQQVKNEAAVAIGELKHKLNWYVKSQASYNQPTELMKQEGLPPSSQVALQGRIHELEVKLEEQKAAEQMSIRSLQQEFEVLKYEEHIKLLETELDGRTSENKLTKLRKSTSQPAVDSDRDSKTQVAGLQNQLSSLKSELIRRQRMIGSRQKVPTRQEDAESLRTNVAKRMVPKPRPRLVSRADLRPKSSTTCSKVLTQEESQTEFKTVCRNAKVDVRTSSVHVYANAKNVEVQTPAPHEGADSLRLQNKCDDLQSRNKLLTEQIVSISCALRANEKALNDMQVRENSRKSLIQHLKASLTKEKLKTLRNALRSGGETEDLRSSGGEVTVDKDKNTPESGLPTEGDLLAEVGQSTARLRSELNITRQRADRLQMQLDTLRGLHLATVTGKPPKKAIERLFDQLAFLEKQQELKNRHLEEYIQCRLLEAHATGECPCAGDAKVAASAAAHWRRIAEHRAGDIARLGREMDRLIALLAELSESASASAKASPRRPSQDAPTEGTITTG